MTKLNPTPPCYPDDEGCTNRSRYQPLTMVFDPVDPDHRVLTFAYENARVLVTLQRVLDYESVWPVIAIDRHTGEQTLIHDGNPTAAEPVFPWTCQPNAAFDTRTGRLILVGETGGYFDCPGDDFALDLATGELSPL